MPTMDAPTSGRRKKLGSTATFTPQAWYPMDTPKGDSTGRGGNDNSQSGALAAAGVARIKRSAVKRRSKSGRR